MPTVLNLRYQGLHIQTCFRFVSHAHSLHTASSSIASLFPTREIMARPSALRLRLSIQRHGLPATRILWTVDEGSNEAFSFADLLGEVNEVVPLESNDWGLEDYAVEQDGFECLHFQPVRKGLHDLDSVE